MPGELGIVQSRSLEVKVVENGVLDAGVGQIACQRLFPHPFGNPHAADRGPQAVLQPAGIAADLTDAVARGNHGQDRLEKRPADDLDLPAIDQFGQAVDIFRMIGVQPLHQRAAYVQRHLQRLVTAKDLQEWHVAVFARPARKT